MGDINNVRDTYKERCQALEDLVRPDILTPGNVKYVQEQYMALCDFLSNFFKIIEDSNKLDDAYGSIYPAYGEPGYRGRTEISSLDVHKAIDEVLDKVKRALVKFKHSLPEDQAAIITDQALLEFLKGTAYEQLELKKI